jgi:hypothetical protein
MELGGAGTRTYRFIHELDDENKRFRTFDGLVDAVAEKEQT